MGPEGLRKIWEYKKIEKQKLIKAKEWWKRVAFRKKITALLTVAGMTAAAFVSGFFGPVVSKQEEESVAVPEKETLYFWYTDDTLTDYLNSAAVAYGESSHVRVIPVLTSGLEYLEQINQASLQSEAVPDLYVISHDALEKACLAGLTSGIEEEDWDRIKEGYPDAARLAVSYHGDIMAYPFYFETSALLYNRTYLEEFVKRKIESEADAAAGEAAMALVEQLEAEGRLDEGMPDLQEETGTEEILAEVGEEQIREQVKEILPDTIEDILAFANEYDAPSQVEAVFRWDVTDIFYNYFFVGNYLTTGGEAGDSTGNMNLYNKEAIRCLEVYQDLNQFFSMDTGEISYEKVLQDFIDGKIVYTVATTDAVARLEEAKKDGSFAYEYSVAPVPDIDEVLQTRSLSVTNCVAVNGYTEHRELAEDFAEFLTGEYTENLYARTGKVAARYGVDYQDPNLQEFVNEYDVSIPMAKMIETSNLWIELEVVFSRIWNGLDVNTGLKELSEKIMTQVTGAPYSETQIIIEEEAVEENEEATEYLDEEDLRRQAREEGSTQAEESSARE